MGAVPSRYRTHPPILVGDDAVVGSTCRQERGLLHATVADGVPERGQSPIVGSVDPRPRVEDLLHDPNRMSPDNGPDEQPTTTSEARRQVGIDAMAQERLDHRRIVEIEGATDAVRHPDRMWPGREQQLHAGRIRELGRVIERLVAPRPVRRQRVGRIRRRQALVGIGARLEQHPGQLGIVEDAGDAVDRRGLLAITGDGVRIRTRGEQPADDLADPRRPFRFGPQQSGEGGVEDRRDTVRSGRRCGRVGPRREDLGHGTRGAGDACCGQVVPGQLRLGG